MMRKWEWIREYCKRQGFEKSAEIADRMDRVLCWLYGDADVGSWRGYLEHSGDGIKETGEIKMGRREVLRDIVSNDAFCIACEREGKECDRCEFGRLTGECNERGSLFDDFTDMWLEESR